MVYIWPSIVDHTWYVCTRRMSRAVLNMYTHTCGHTHLDATQKHTLTIVQDTSTVHIVQVFYRYRGILIIMHALLVLIN